MSACLKNVAASVRRRKTVKIERQDLPPYVGGCGTLAILKHALNVLLTFLLVLCSTAWAADFAAICADRTAVERVYHSHLLGDKPPFEQAMPPALIERLVKQDLRKEAVLKKVYGVEMTPALLEAEVQRINATTRAPETLAELKAVLGGDPVRFGQTVAKPIVVERLLRNKFENDDSLHGTPRRETESVREKLLAAKKSGAPTTNLLALLRQSHTNEVSETAWQLGPPPPETSTPNADEIEIRKRFGPNAQVISSPQSVNRKFYFEDLPPALQNVLRAQLRQAGDVSAVIETSGGFLLYVCKEKTDTALIASCFSLRKRDYEQWLNQQSEMP